MHFEPLGHPVLVTRLHPREQIESVVPVKASQHTDASPGQSRSESQNG